MNTNTDSTHTASHLVSSLKKLRETNPNLAAFFRNQQRFLHLYALARGAEVTATYITDLVQALDPERTFGPRTYYHLRRELEEAGWIEPGSETPGRAENPHRIKPKMLEDFRDATIEASVVERPVVIDKYRLFDTGLRFSGLAEKYRQAPEIVAELRKALAERKAQDNQRLFSPDFLLYGLAGELAALVPEKSRMEQEQVIWDPAEQVTGVLIQGTSRDWRFALADILPRARAHLAECLAYLAPRSAEAGLDIGGAHLQGAFEGASCAAEEPGVRPPKPQATALLVQLGPDESGQLRLGAAVSGERLGAAQLRYRFGEAAGQLPLYRVEDRWENDTPVARPEEPMAALGTLRLSLVGSEDQLPTAVFSVAVNQGEGQHPMSVVIQSCATGLTGAEVHCLVGGVHGVDFIHPIDGDRWTSEIEITASPEPQAFEFALWIPSAVRRSNA